MRRLAVLLLLLVLAAPASVFAGSWRLFQSRPLALSVRYPRTWHAVASYLPGDDQVQLGHAGPTNYSLTIQALPIKPAGKFVAVMQRFHQYQRRTHQSPGRVHWRTVRVGGHLAGGTISRPPTEGGVAMADALYVMRSRHHVYEITEVAYGHPSPANLARFPAVYQHILSTLRFK